MTRRGPAPITGVRMVWPASGVIARAMHLFATTSAEQVLELGKAAAVAEMDKREQRTSANERTFQTDQ